MSEPLSKPEQLTPERLAQIRAWLMADDDDIAEADGGDALTFAEGCVLDLLSERDALADAHAAAVAALRMAEAAAMALCLNHEGYIMALTAQRDALRAELSAVHAANGRRFEK